ncbi:MAG: efflux RND transporter periplasmic adaptor subunit [Planctomycetes bacterium]|nr:efflux RND transporter periplasmic adaptor subunit [Planctomycetota bacterium]
MKPNASRWIKIGLAVAIVAIAVVSLRAWQRARESEKVADPHHHAKAPRAALVENEPQTIELPSDVYERMQAHTVTVIKAPPPAALRMEGSLFLNADRLTHVHTRFAGEVVELGTLEIVDKDATPNRLNLHLRFGDPVKKGQLMAVIWSKDLGEKKSELVDALSRLYLDEETFTRLEPLFRQGSLAERTLRETERLVEADRIAVDRAERTLRTWRLTDQDLEEIRTEARRLHANKGKTEGGLNQSWARVEIRSAIDGVIVEKNLNIGDYVETALDLYKIANLTRLDVLAHAYEEDLELLEELKPEEREWQVKLMSGSTEQPLIGSFDQIGRIIDPNQHTALIRGWVDNASGRLRVGQFVSAEVKLPANPHEVAVPATALVDQDGETSVFVRRRPNELKFTLRRVFPTRRHDQQVYIASQLTVEQSKHGLHPLRAGEEVVDSGCLEMARELRDLSANTKVANK